MGSIGREPLSRELNKPLCLILITGPEQSKGTFRVQIERDLARSNRFTFVLL